VRRPLPANEPEVYGPALRSEVQVFVSPKVPNSRDLPTGHHSLDGPCVDLGSASGEMEPSHSSGISAPLPAAESQISTRSPEAFREA